MKKWMILLVILLLTGCAAPAPDVEEPVVEEPEESPAPETLTPAPGSEAPAPPTLPTRPGRGNG